VPTTLILVLASDEDLGDENIPALAGALLKLLVSAGDKQRSLIWDSAVKALVSMHDLSHILGYASLNPRHTV
jgi:hypothetical protein